MATELAPAPGSFLWAVGQAHPNDTVTCANVSGTAGSVARDVRAMVAEIERLTAQNERLTAALLAVS